MDLQKLSSTNIQLKGAIASKPPTKKEILTPTVIREKGVAYQFEDETINFLYSEQSELGIKEVYRLQNALIDAYLITDEGLGIAVEFKLALNWNKSNVARSQIINFAHEGIFEKLELPPPSFGLVFFRQFSGDWNRTQGDRDGANGWYRFYQEQRGYDQLIKIHILQLTEGVLFNPGLT